VGRAWPSLPTARRSRQMPHCCPSAVLGANPLGRRCDHPGEPSGRESLQLALTAFSSSTVTVRRYRIQHIDSTKLLERGDPPAHPRGVCRILYRPLLPPNVFDR
jgi:hypothetical protein